MPKKIKRIAKLQFRGGQAKPGPELASLGINMPQFCTQFNDASKDRQGKVVPVLITAYDDKSFKMELKTTPAAELLKEAAKVEKGAAKPNVETVGTISVEDLKKIAEYKLVDLTAYDLDGAMRLIAGTAKNMGIKIEGWDETQAKGDQNHG